MTEQQITAAVKKLQTKDDFLNLINAIAIDELGGSFSPFTMKQLNYYCRTSYKPQKRYRKFYIPKKSGGKPREILAPCPTLKAILHYINIILKSTYVPSNHAMGFIKGRSVKDNASVHVGKNYVFNTDLKDFFPSISQYRVWKNLQYAPFNFSDELAKLVAGLCCVVDGKGKEYKGYLPQGSPCSPIITNIVCQKLDKKLSNLARRYNLTYTRYADDITFSSMHNVYQENSAFISEFMKVVEAERFKINERKTRLQKRGERQEVTGLVVNSKVNTVREYVRDIQSVLYIWERYGFNIAYTRFLTKYLKSKAYHRTTTPDMCNVVEGKLLYLKMIVGETSSVYKRLTQKFERLRPVENKRKEKITFCSSYRYSDFVSLFNTTINVTIEETINGTQHFVASCLIEGKEHRVWINKIVAKELGQIQAESSDYITLIEKCYVCLAQQGASTFWLLMRYDPTSTKKKLGAQSCDDKIYPIEQSTLVDLENDPILSALDEVVFDEEKIIAQIQALDNIEKRVNDPYSGIINNIEDEVDGNEKRIMLIAQKLSEDEQDEINRVNAILDKSALFSMAAMPVCEEDECRVLSDNTALKDAAEDVGTKKMYSTDELLNELVNSNFTDLNILLQWDRIKKS